MATSRQYLIPGWGYINEAKGNEYLIPGWGYVNETVSSSSGGSAYINGTSMIQTGTSILKQGTTPLINKGMVYDPLNVIPH